MHLDTGNNRDQGRHKKAKKRKEKNRDSIPPTFPPLLLWLLARRSVELHFYDLLVPPLLDKGGEGWGDFAYMNTCHGSVLIIRMARKTLIITLIRM